MLHEKNESSNTTARRVGRKLIFIMQRLKHFQIDTQIIYFTKNPVYQYAYGYGPGWAMPLS
jgi:hypothetical protein